MTQLAAIKEKALSLAHQAGEILKEGYGKAHQIQSKEGVHNLVTECDTLSEALLIQEIKKAFPSHGILTEESGYAASKQEDILWIIDPLDGTVNFAHHIPFFSVSIAVAIKGIVHIGVVYQPLLNELFWAQKGAGAFLHKKRLSISKETQLDNSFIATGFPYNVKNNPKNCIDHLQAVLRRGLPIRRLGSAALDLCYVAAGRYDGYFEVSLKPWDMAAGKLIVEEAGGKVTHYDQSSYDLFSEKDIIASNGFIHAELAQVLGV